MRISEERTARRGHFATRRANSGTEKIRCLVVQHPRSPSADPVHFDLFRCDANQEVRHKPVVKGTGFRQRYVYDDTINAMLRTEIAVSVLGKATTTDDIKVKIELYLHLECPSLPRMTSTSTLKTIS